MSKRDRLPITLPPRRPPCAVCNSTGHSTSRCPKGSAASLF